MRQGRGELDQARSDLAAERDTGVALRRQVRRG